MPRTPKPKRERTLIVPLNLHAWDIQKIEERARAKGRSFEEMVNEILDLGIEVAWRQGGFMAEGRWIPIGPLAGRRARRDAQRRLNLTRKQIAQRVGMSPASIKRNERALGLDRIRVRVNPRLVLYPEQRTLQILRAQGFEV